MKSVMEDTWVAKAGKLALNSDDFLSLAGTTVTILGTVYLISETGKLIKQLAKPYKSKNKTGPWEYDFKI